MLCFVMLCYVYLVILAEKREGRIRKCIGAGARVPCQQAVEKNG